MSNRLDQKREAKLQPVRLDYALSELDKLNIAVIFKTDSRIDFIYKTAKCSLFPFSGWHTGKSIKDGRGIENLLNQLKS